MQLRRWRRWAHGLAAGVLGLALLIPVAVRGDGSDEPPGEGERVIKIGPQAVVIEDQHGRVRMYDDPSQQAPACKSTADCWGKALGILGVFSALTYEDLTEGVEGSGRVAGSGGSLE